MKKAVLLIPTLLSTKRPWMRKVIEASKMGSSSIVAPIKQILDTRDEFKKKPAKCPRTEKISVTE